MAGKPPGVGKAAVFNSLPNSKYAGVRTARETANQPEFLALGVQSRRTLGCTLIPVRGFSSNLLPASRDSLLGARRISSCRNALYCVPCWFRNERVGLLAKVAAS